MLLLFVLNCAGVGTLTLLNVTVVFCAVVVNLLRRQGLVITLCLCVAIDSFKC